MDTPHAVSGFKGPVYFGLCNIWFVRKYFNYFGKFQFSDFFTSLDAAGAALAAVRVENRKTCAEIPWNISPFDSPHLPFSPDLACNKLRIISAKINVQHSSRFVN